jgi:transposase InsO family protein
LEEALARWGRPEIFNTDQGSQFTGAAFTGTLVAAGIRVSMDGRGGGMMNGENVASRPVHRGVPGGRQPIQRACSTLQRRNTR